MTTTTRERSVILTAPEVRDALAGRLMELRRPVKPQPPADATEVFAWYEPRIPAESKAEEGCYYRDARGLHFLGSCPLGESGTVLWCREAFVTGYDTDDSGYLVMEDEHGNELPEKVWYRATESDMRWMDDDGWSTDRIPWKSAAQMPRSFCRLRLLMLSVRVERTTEGWFWVAGVRRAEGEAVL